MMFIYGAEGKNNGCNFYRIRQPLMKMAMNGIPCGITSELTLDEQGVWLDKADVIVTQAAMSEKFLAYMKEEKGNGKKFVIDYDDNIFCVSPFNPSYKVHGVEEVRYELGNGKLVYVKDGERGFDLMANRARIDTFKKVLTMADMVTTPSKILAEVFKKYNNNVKVLKNYLDLNIWKPLNIVKDDKIRIVWQGGHSHFEDWFEVRDALKIVMEKYKNVVLVIMGSEFEGSALPSDRVEKIGWVCMDAYPHVFKTINADIGICPLINSSFNVCKSELKWEEYSSLKIPTVASMTHPYSDYIEDGETGFLCRNTDEWVEKLSLLIESKEIRELVGGNARKHVEENYDADKKWVEYESAYKSLKSRILEVV